MECASVRDRLRDLVRGRAEPSEEAELRRHLAGCEACRHEEQAERLLDEALATRLPRHAAPAALRRELAAKLDRGQRGATVATLRRPRPAATRSALVAVAALALAAAGYGTGRVAQGRSASAGLLADEVVTDHLRVLASSRPPDVESTSSHQVKPWFEGRLDFAPVVPGDRGELSLVGGSLGYVFERKAAVVSYALRRHRVTLLVFPRAGLPGFEGVPLDGSPVRAARRGFTVALWAAGDLGYALVADVGAEELGHLADDLAPETRRAPSPG
jgi:anti-sigma factor RsiW